MISPLLFLLFTPYFITAQEKAEVDIRVSGACSPIYLSRRGIEVSKYKPSIKFNPDKIQLIPKNPVIPGCVKIKAEGVEILRPVKNLVAEIEMRIGGSPDPNNPTLPCSKKIDERVNQCPCARVDNACVFCDFCKQLKAQSAHITSVRKSFTDHKMIDDDCKCDEMQPGLYDIETEMCTPEIDDAREYIPAELQSSILERRPISMFITVYLMDMEQRGGRESYLSAFGRAILQRRMAQSTVACFLLGIDVKLALPNFP
ncbi:hypothetical protein PRIPAC_76375 [Pristionchus pacificus]|uniref:Uncharacterized protein n=1 Tax=Pristionchus pacificus TaxID=54126 RepID=A0A2A6BES0_PRIPA|nr:hypothetical protein PRIPAC_76375 [Pristionchus pacificus]|eukprot:PDM64374.1 hypothetical protein PRIPAC_52630 [Pristionchus pacificus]